MNTGCFKCDKAQWDADGCTCEITGRLVGNVARGCEYRKDIEPQTCPFCGGKMALVVCREPNYFEGKLNGYQYQVVCDASSGKGCGASCGYQDDLETAIKEWNRRAENG